MDYITRHWTCKLDGHCPVECGGWPRYWSVSDNLAIRFAYLRQDGPDCFWWVGPQGELEISRNSASTDNRTRLTPSEAASRLTPKAEPEREPDGVRIHESPARTGKWYAARSTRNGTENLQHDGRWNSSIDGDPSRYYFPSREATLNRKPEPQASPCARAQGDRPPEPAKAFAKVTGNSLWIDGELIVGNASTEYLRSRCDTINAAHERACAERVEEAVQEAHMSDAWALETLTADLEAERTAHEATRDRVKQLDGVLNERNLLWAERDSLRSELSTAMNHLAVANQRADGATARADKTEKERDGARGVLKDTEEILEATRQDWIAARTEAGRLGGLLCAERAKVARMAGQIRGALSLLNDYGRNITREEVMNILSGTTTPPAPLLSVDELWEKHKIIIVLAYGATWDIYQYGTTGKGFVSRGHPTNAAALTAAREYVAKGTP